jgi:hypothetical protein
MASSRGGDIASAEPASVDQPEVRNKLAQKDHGQGGQQPGEAADTAPRRSTLGGAGCQTRWRCGSRADLPQGFEPCRLVGSPPMIWQQVD